MQHLRRAASRNAVLIVLIVILLAVAVYAYFRISRPDVTETGEPIKMYCTNCKQPFTLNHHQFAEIWDKKQYKFSGGELQGVGAGDKGLLFQCPKCKQFTATTNEPPPTTPPK